MTKAFALTWIAALSLAAACLAIFSGHPDSETQLPAACFPPVAHADTVFIGSSLTRNLVWAKTPGASGSEYALLAADGLSELLATRLLAHAIDAGAETIFLEINPYAQEYRDFSEPAFLAEFVLGARRLGARVAFNGRRALGLGKPCESRIRHKGALGGGKSFDPAKLQPGDYYRFLHLQPSHGARLRSELARASDRQIGVVFFSPPRPQSAISRAGGEYEALLTHLSQVAADYGVPLWHAGEAWPNDHFKDVLAHANAVGRNRFHRELAHWLGAPP